MKIILVPIRIDEELLIDVEGDIVYVNGELFDFSPLKEGGTLPGAAIKSQWFCGDVTRTDGELVMSIRNPFGPNAPESTRFPQPITVIEDGSVALPIYDMPAEEVAE